MILEPPKIKPVTVSIVSPSICHEVMGLDAMILVFKPANSWVNRSYFWIITFNFTNYGAWSLQNSEKSPSMSVLKKCTFIFLAVFAECIIIYLIQFIYMLLYPLYTLLNPIAKKKMKRDNCVRTHFASSLYCTSQLLNQSPYLSLSNSFWFMIIKPLSEYLMAVYLLAIREE